MKKRVFLIALAVFPFSTFAVDISNMHSIVFIDESSDDIDGDFRERYDCDEGDYSPRYDLSPPGLATVPDYDSNGIHGVYISSGSASFSCVSLNNNSKADDIYFENYLGYNYASVYYNAGSSGDVSIVRLTSSSNANFCYVYDKDGIDGNDDKYIYPVYKDNILTIHITDSTPPSNLNECD